MVLFSSVDTLRKMGTTKIWGGDLRLFFSAEEAGDLTPTPAPGVWTPGNSVIKQTITLPTGEQLATQFQLAVDPAPGTLYLFPIIQVTDGKGPIFPQPGITPTQTGQPSPGTPAYVAWNGSINAINPAFTGQAGFQMTVPFNGVSADCHGRWWAIWSPAS
jgi:hypothetical protein